MPIVEKWLYELQYIRIEYFVTLKTMLTAVSKSKARACYKIRF